MLCSCIKFVLKLLNNIKFHVRWLSEIYFLDIFIYFLNYIKYDMYETWFKLKYWYIIYIYIYIYIKS